MALNHTLQGVIVNAIDVAIGAWMMMALEDSQHSAGSFENPPDLRGVLHIDRAGPIEQLVNEYGNGTV